MPAQIVDLDSVWDRSLVQHPRMKNVITMIEESHGWCDSWLLEMLQEDRMWQDDEHDNLLYNAYKNCTELDLAYYFPLMCCHVYSLVLATMLELKFPDIEWRIVYFTDHYVVMKLEDIKNKHAVVYDMLTFLYSKAGIYLDNRTLEADVLNSTNIKTIEEQYKMVSNEEYY